MTPQVLLLSAARLGTAAYAQTARAVPERVRRGIQRRRAMGAAHEAAARCLGSGKDEEPCLKELQAACKGLAIGKYCGMRHEH